MNFDKIKENNEALITNRHHYVANIIRELFRPEQYNFLCEIGAGDLELAKYLSNWYRQITTYETSNYNTSNIPNLDVQSTFYNSTDISNYDLLISISPYCYEIEGCDDFDPEEETKLLVDNIITKCVNYEKDLFLILPDTQVANYYTNEEFKNKYKKIILEQIKLYYMRFGNLKEAENNVLILKN